MRRWLGNWRLLAAILVVLGILGVALWPEQIEVNVAAAQRGPLQVTIDEEGETRVRDRFVVSAPVTGRLERIELEPGDPVVRGKTVLARLTPAQPVLLDNRTQAELTAAVEASRAAIGAAIAERDRAAATLARAQSSLKRQLELQEAGAISREELETSQTGLKVAEEALKAANFAVSRAEFDLQMTRARLQQPGAGGRTITIVSPIDGIVLKRLHESEQVVPVGESLVEVGNPGAMEVVADFLSADAVRIPRNARVLLEQGDGGMPLEGRVRRVEPSGFMKVSALGVEEQRVNVLIDFVDAASATRSLGDNYRVEVHVVLSESPDVLKIPVGVLFRRGQDWTVFVAENGRVRSQRVELGQRNATEAQVVTGLEAGQEVVLHPPDGLQDAVRVTRRAEP